MIRKKRKSNDLRSNVENQNGAVIIEASMALPFFMFMMFILYSLINIAQVQARMSVALDAAAKQLAEYSHVYFATEMDNIFTGKDGASSEIANTVADFLETIGENVGSVSSELGEFFDEAGKALSGDSLTDWGKDGLGRTLGEQVMEKNMVSFEGDTAEAFKKRNRIENLEMNGTKFLENNSKSVFLQVNYDIRVIRLLNFEYSFHMSHCAYTEAWGGE